MKIKLFFIFTIFTVLSLQASAEVIQISSFDDLCKIGQDPRYPLDGNYILTQNIDASPSRNMGRDSIGTIIFFAGFIPIGTFENPFIGTFDGKGFVISNLYISRRVEDHIGLFGNVGDPFRGGRGGEIKNVGLVDVSIGFRGSIGSLAGVLYNSTVTNCYSTGEVNTSTDNVGGLVGISYNSTITDCHSAIKVVSNSPRNAGGIVGYLVHSTITNSHFTGNVQGQNNVGGLIGYMDSSSQVTNCYSTGSVIGEDYLGGLVGRGFSSTITDCYSTGSVSGRGYLGGLIGGSSSTVTNCYSTGSVSDVSRTNGGNGVFIVVGGLIGSSSGTVSNCYSTGAVSSNSLGVHILVGGLIGSITGTVSNCYSTGVVSGHSIETGGLVGRIGSNNGTITNCFWDTRTSGLTTSAGGEGRTTAQMKQQSNYTGWDFNDIWQIDEGTGYPYLSALAHTSVIENKITRKTVTAHTPLITVKNKTLTIKTAPNSNSELQIKLFDMRGKTLAHFNTRGSSSFSLSKIPAGRYLVETKDRESGKRIEASAIVLR